MLKKKTIAQNYFNSGVFYEKQLENGECFHLTAGFLVKSKCLGGFQYLICSKELFDVKKLVDLSIKTANYSNNYCSKFTIRCPERGICISRLSLCDGVKDCPSGFDEKDCNQELYFNCDKNQKAHIKFVCNHRKDCTNGQDEKNCSKFLNLK